MKSFQLQRLSAAVILSVVFCLAVFCSCTSDTVDSFSDTTQVCSQTQRSEYRHDQTQAPDLVYIHGETKAYDELYGYENTEIYEDPYRYDDPYGYDDPYDYNEYDDYDEYGYDDPQEDDTPKSYHDDRVAAYVGDGTPDYKKKTFKWESYDKRWNYEIWMNMDQEVYDYYRNLPRYMDYYDYLEYIEDEYSQEAVQTVVKNLRENAERTGSSEQDLIREAVNFVQNIEYVDDLSSTGREDYPKYPFETLFDQCGDCEDSSLLLAAILKEMNYGVALLHYPDHIAVAVLGNDELEGTYFEYEGKKYYYVEPTYPGWSIGQVPEKYNDVSANVLVVN